MALPSRLPRLQGLAGGSSAFAGLADHFCSGFDRWLPLLGKCVSDHALNRGCSTASAVEATFVFPKLVRLSLDFLLSLSCRAISLSDSLEDLSEDDASSPMLVMDDFLERRDGFVDVFEDDTLKL